MRTFAGSRGAWVRGLAVTQNDWIAIAGPFEATVDFGSPSVPDERTAIGHDDSFAALWRSVP